MPTKKNEPTAKKQPRTRDLPDPAQTRVYEEALAKYAAAVEHLGRKDFVAARDLFNEVVESARQEPELTQRARGYAVVCERQLTPPRADPSSGEERYAHAVFLSNSGEWDEAVRLLDAAITVEPTSVRCLYARACAWALKGSNDRAVADLRQAIAGDPTIRFQAVNDPDFEKIREEPSFIDIIEPTPAGP